MKDPIRFIRQAIISALDGNVSFGGSNVHLFIIEFHLSATERKAYIKVYSVQTNEADENREDFSF